MTFETNAEQHGESLIVTNTVANIRRLYFYYRKCTLIMYALINL